MHWRQIRDYSGGMLTDWGAHLLDTAQVANSAEQTGPVEVEGDGEIPKNSMATTLVEFKLHYRYANGVELFVESGGVSIRFEGTDGWVGNNGWRPRWKPAREELLRHEVRARDQQDLAAAAGEHRNFLDCVKSRKPTTYTAEDGHRLSTVMHIGNIAMELGRKLRWDPASEAFLATKRPTALRSRPARGLEEGVTGSEFSRRWPGEVMTNMQTTRRTLLGTAVATGLADADRRKKNCQ